MIQQGDIVVGDTMARILVAEVFREDIGRRYKRIKAVIEKAS